MYKVFCALLLGFGILLPAAEWKMTRQEPENDFTRRIVPQVRETNFNGKTTTVAPGTPIRAGEEMETAAGLLAGQLKRNGLPGARGEVEEITLSIMPDEKKPEGYRIAISPSRVEVTGNSPRGLLFAVQSLRQLLQPADDGVSRLPVGTIDDWPDFAWRGVFTTGLASSPQRETLLETFSLLKLNTMIVRVDQFLKYERFPSLGHKSASVAKSEYRDFVRRGRAFGMEMIPNSSLYTHFAWAMWGEYGYLLEVPQKAISNFSTPQIDHPDTAKLIRGIMEEVCDAFDSPKYYHVGQDELRYAPTSSAKDGGHSRRDQFATALKLLKANCDDLGVRMMMWADQMLESRNGGAPDHTGSLRGELPRDVILADFTYFPREVYDTPAVLAGDGFQVVGTSWYDTTCISEYYDTLAKTPGVLGTINSMWGGMGAFYTVPEHQMAVAWSAENSWSVGNPRYENYRNFPTDTFYFLSHLKSPLVRSYLPVDLGEAARSSLKGEDSLFGRGAENDFSNMPPVLNRGDFTFERDGDRCLLLGGETTGALRETLLRFEAQQVDSIAFAHVTDLPARRALAFTNLDNKSFYDPKGIAVYTILYEDGDSVAVNISYTREITDWNEPAGAAGAPVVWDGRTPSGKLARVFGYRWNNPHPDKAVSGIRIDAGQSPLPLAIFGISLERNEKGKK